MRTLLVLRRVCKSLRGVIERRMRHIVLTPWLLTPEVFTLEDGSEGYEWTPRKGAHARPFHHPSAEPATLIGDPTIQIEDPSYFETAPDAEHHAAQGLLTQDTRVVDVRGFFHPEEARLDYFLRGMFPRLHTLRMTQNPDDESFYTAQTPFDCRTLVLFSHPEGVLQNRKNKDYRFALQEHIRTVPGRRRPPPADDDLYWTYGHRRAPGREYPSALGPQSEWPRIPPQPLEHPGHFMPAAYLAGDDVRRIVVNLDGGAGAPTASFPYLLDMERHVREVAVVVPRLRSATDRGVLTASEPEIGRNVLEALRSPFAMHVVVGLELVGADFPAKLRTLLAALTVGEVQPFVDYGIDDALTRAMAPARRAKFRQLAEDMQKPAHYWHVSVGFHHCTYESDGEAETAAGCPHDECEGCCAEPFDLKMAKKARFLGLQQMVNSRLERLQTVTVEEYRKRVGRTRAAIRTVQYPPVLERRRS